MNITHLVSMIPDWLAVTEGRDISVGLSREDALRCATVLRRLLLDRKVDPMLVVVDDSLKAVFQALVSLVTESELPPCRRVAEEADAIYDFIQRVDWVSDDVGEKEDLLRRCAAAGWTALRVNLSALALDRLSMISSVAPGDSVAGPISRLNLSNASLTEARRVASTYLATPTTERSELVLRDSSVLRALCDMLSCQNESNSGEVLREASRLYTWLSVVEGRLGLFDERACLLGSLAFVAGSACRFLGRRDDTEPWLLKAEQHFRATVNPGPALARASYARLALYYDMRRYKEVLERAPILALRFDRLSMEREARKSRYLYAVTLKESGRRREAQDAIEMLYHETKRAADVSLHGRVLTILAELRSGESGLDVAAALVDAAEALYESGDPLPGLAHLFGVTGETLRESGQLGSAVEAYQASAASYSKMGMATYESYIRVVLAETLIALNRPREAELEILQALPTIEKQHMVPEGFAAIALLRESVSRQNTNPEALRELREHLRRH